MPTTKRTFLKGKMNLDIDERLLPEGEYGEALNIRVANSEGSDLGAIEKCLSNKQLTSLDLGENTYTLGSLRDEFEEKLYWAVLSDNGCFIIEHEVATQTTTLVLNDTRSGANNVLGFVPNKRLQMVLIVDSDNDNRLLAFTDNNTQPKCINIERAKTYGENGFDEEMILLIKKPPLYAPTIVLGDTGDDENNIEERFLLFFTRYKYLDGEYSPLSPASDFAFKAKKFRYDYSTGTNDSMTNFYNQATISFETGSSLVTDIEIIFKESGSNTLFLIESLNKSEESWSDDTTESITFSNNKIYRALPEKELYRLYDNVPLLAKAIAVINNRIVFGNYTENYDLVDDQQNKTVIDFSVEHIDTSIVSGSPTKSLKSNRDYELAIVYLDDYGRMTTPLTSLTNTVHIPTSNCIDKNTLQVTIKNKAPEFAKYYRFFIKQNKTDYETISPIIFYQDGAYRWIKLENSDKDKIKEGDQLIVKSDSSQILPTLVKTRVLEVTTQDKNFLQPEDVTDTIQEKSGLYFKIKPDGFRLNTDDFENFSFETYHNSRRRYHDVLKDTTAVIYPAYFYGDTLDDMTSGGTCTLPSMTDARYIVKIDGLATSATGTVTLDSGASGSVDSITVNGVNIMSGAVAFNTDLPTTATDVASNITANTSSPNYTAVAVGSTITITSVTKGTSANGFVVTSSTTTITTTDVNMSGANDDTFQWSDDNGSSFTNNVAITGVAQTLSNGVEVTFGAKIGHSLLDEWNFYACGELSSDDSRAYGWFRINGDIGETLTSSGLTTDDEIIENGAVIDLTYDEWNRGDVYWEVNNVSGNQYANMIEWYYREDIGSKIVSAFPGYDVNNIFFMRCVVYNSSRGNAQYSSYNSDGFITMIVKSTNSQSSTKWVYVRAKTELFQSDGSTRLIFELDPEEDNNDIFYEIGQTYEIDENGNHLKDKVSDTSQNYGTNDAIINLDVYNCYAWGNAFESYKVKDYFNAKSMKLDSRPSTPIENYRQNKRISSYTWSNVYEQTTNYNAINEFNLGLVNYNDLDDKYGAIQRMVSQDNVLDVYQEDKVIKVFYDESLIYNKDGSSNLAKSDDILKNFIPYTGEYGISTHPESLTVYGNYAYWSDAKRGVILRKGRSGIEVISNFGMRDWFRDALNGVSTFILGGYDPYFGQYVISLNGKTLTYDEKVKGWTSFHSWLPDEIIRINNRFFTIKDSQLYIHNDADNTQYNNFYGDKYKSSIVTVINEFPSEDKIIKTIVQESTRPWSTYIETNLSYGTIKSTEFNQRESKWMAYTRKNQSGDLNGRVQGLGEILNVNVAQITFAQIPTLVSVGETLYQVNGGVSEEIGVITNIENNIITVPTQENAPIQGSFAYTTKDARIQGSEIRGYYAKLTLENEDNGNAELFAINSNIARSFAPTSI